MSTRPPFGPDELALLAAIHAAPRDDVPRLVYADWQDEHGDPAYAEFIRLQCQTAAATPDSEPIRYSPREVTLLKKHEVRWRGERLRAHQWLPGDLRYRRFERGLPHVDRYTANHEAETAGLSKTLSHVAPHYQLLVLLNVYPGSACDPVPLLAHPIFGRARWVHIRSLGGPSVAGIGRTEAVLPHAVVAEAVRVFGPRPHTVVRFGPLSAESARYVEGHLPNLDRTPDRPSYPTSR